MKAKESYLIIGGDSLIGSCLKSYIKNRGNDVFWTSKRDPLSTSYLDLSMENIRLKIPDGIRTAFFCAARNSIQDCELHPEETEKVNVTNTLKVIRQLDKKSIPVVFFSSTLVFGDMHDFPDETVRTSPATVYGQQKNIVEKELIKMNADHSIIRLSKVISPELQLFHDWVKKLKKKEKIEAFYDYYFSPVSVQFATKVIFDIAKYGKGGIWHISGDRKISYFEAGTVLAAVLDLPEYFVKGSSVKGIMDGRLLSQTSTLMCTRLESCLKIKPPDVIKTVREMVVNL